MDQLSQTERRNPEWFLLSYKKPTSASSCENGYSTENAVDENIQTWWKATKPDSGEWILLDLEEVKEIHAIQINFADDHLEIPIPGELAGEQKDRYIEEKDDVTRWILEGSTDCITYEMITDKSQVETDLSHDFVLLEEGKEFRYLRLTVLEVPYHQPACISGFRVFGIGNGEKAKIPAYQVLKTGEMELQVDIEPEKDFKTVVGYNILWGTKPDKLYHSYMMFDTKKEIRALVKGQEYYVRVDAFNEVGITEGIVKKVEL